MTTNWDRQTGETEEWYERFKLYLYMGPDRTIAASHAFAGRVARGAAHGHLESWRRAAKRHLWKERAAAFDAEVMRKALAQSITQSGDGVLATQSGHNIDQEGGTNDERLRMVAELLHQVYGVLRQADMRTLSKEEARQLLPTFRLFFRDLLRIHQSEVAQHLATSEGKGGAEGSAEGLMRFLMETGGLQMLLADLKRVIDSPVNETGWRPLRDVLAQLYPDDASARRIADQAHLDGARIHFSARAVDSWHAILTEAAHAGRLEQIIQAVQQEYGANAELVKAVRHVRQSQMEVGLQREIDTKIQKRQGRRQA